MRHALHAPCFGTFGDPRLLVELAQEAEDAGWDGFFLWDHILFASDAPFADPWVAMSAMAVATSRIRLGTLVTPLSRRRPWKVAREAVTLDHLSGGRLVLGVGLGVDFWREFSAFDGEAGDDRARAELVDDGIEILTRLWSGERVSYQGRRLAVDDVRFLPPPLQQPRIPLWSAALWPLREGPVRRAARCDGVMPFHPRGMVTPDDVRALRTRIGRHRHLDDGPFDICLHGPRGDAAGYESAGVTWFVEPFTPEEALARVRDVVSAGPPGP